MATKKYQVYVIDTISYQYIVEAESEDEAEDLAEEMHDDGDAPFDKECLDTQTERAKEIV